MARSSFRYLGGVLGLAFSLLLTGCIGAYQVKDHLKVSFDDMARDLAKFLVRLRRGEAPRKE
jgi:hypothetical protein